MQLVREENVTKRSIARVVSFDEESLGAGAEPSACSATAPPT